MQDIPLYSADLIKELDIMYPERSPSINMTEKEVWFEAGARRVVRNLIFRLSQQEQDALERELIT